MLDLGKKRGTNTFDVEILEAGRPTGALITVLGIDSDAYRKAADDQARELRKRMQRAGRIDVTSFMADPEIQRQERAKLLAACTVRWNDKVCENGTPLPCTRFNAERLYLEVPEVADQVDVAINDRRNFLGE